MSKSIGSLLAVAVTTSIALANGGEGEKKRGEDPKNGNPYQSGQATWKPGAGITLADTDEFKLTLKGQLQVQWAFQALDSSPDEQSFDIRRARIDLSGHVWSKDLTYKMKLELTDDFDVDLGVPRAEQNGTVKDAWAHWRFMKSDDGGIALRAGQSKTYHGLEATGSSTGLYFVERSSASDTFAVTRSRGAWLHGAYMENRLRWNAGAQNGDVASDAVVAEHGEETSNPDNELTYVANVSWDPIADITGGKSNESWMQGDLGDYKETIGTIGAGVMLGNNRDQTNTFDVESTQFNVNTAWGFGSGITAQGEIFVRSDDPDVGADEDSSGWYVQACYTLPMTGDSKIQWGFGLRFNMIETDDTLTFLDPSGLGGNPGDVSELSAVVDAFYHGHACKTQFEYTLQDVNPDGAIASDTNHILRIQFQLLF
jgi:hypothetical protein